MVYDFRFLARATCAPFTGLPILCLQTTHIHLKRAFVTQAYATDSKQTPSFRILLEHCSVSKQWTKINVRGFISTLAQESLHNLPASLHRNTTSMPSEFLIYNIHLMRTRDVFRSGWSFLIESIKLKILVFSNKSTMLLLTSLLS